MTHSIEIVESRRFGLIQHQAQCRCGWKGTLRVAYSSAQGDGTAHVSAHTARPPEAQPGPKPTSDHERQAENEARDELTDREVEKLADRARELEVLLTTSGNPNWAEVYVRAQTIANTAIRRGKIHADSTLSPTQRAAIRAIYDEHGTSVRKATLDSLIKRGLVDDRFVRPKLSRAGLREHKRIMASGDGPEDLKELFRFKR